MRRFFLPPGSVQGRRLIFTGRDARYISRVLRLPRGEKIVGFDGSGREYRGVIAILSPRRVEAIVNEVIREGELPSFRVALAQGIIKGGAFDQIVRQTTEMGVDEIYPLKTSYTVVRPGALASRKQQRWEAIAVDAARQSGRVRSPRIHPPATWPELLNLTAGYELKILLWEKEEKQSLKSVLEEFPEPPSSLLLTVGPEGGFTDEEASAAIEAGFRPAFLAKTILRSATAPLAGLACLYYQFQSDSAPASGEKENR